MEEKESFYSDELNVIIEKKPLWLIRYGTGGMLLFLLLFLCAAWIVEYPDKAIGKVNIVTPRPPVDLVAKINSVISKKFDVKENDTLSKGDPILLLESTTSYDQVQKIKKALSDSIILKEKILPFWVDSLGQIQSAYNNFMLAAIGYIEYYKNKPFDKRIASLRGILATQKRGIRLSKMNISNSKKSYNLEEKEFDRYKTLFNKGVISESEYAKLKQALLQREMGFVDNRKRFNSELSAKEVSQRNLLELQLEKMEYESQLLLNLEKSVNDVKSQINLWETNHLIKSPINGRLSFFLDLNMGDFIVSGEKVITVIPLQEDSLQAIGMFPVLNAGKIIEGSKVIIKLDSYPFQEYGTVQGEVVAISEVPSESHYRITVNLPNKLNTNYEKQILFKQRLTGIAEVITEDKSMLSRIFGQFMSILKN